MFPPNTRNATLSHRNEACQVVCLRCLRAYALKPVATGLLAHYATSWSTVRALKNPKALENPERGQKASTKMRSCKGQGHNAMRCVALGLVGLGFLADAAISTGRGYELIDPSTPSPHLVGGAAVSDNGSRVTFVRQTNTPSLVGAVRRQDGWRRASMMPPGGQLLDGVYGNGIFAYTRDRTEAVVGVYPGVYLSGAEAILTRLDLAGDQTVLAAPVPQVWDVLVSDDGEHVFAMLGTNIYDFARTVPLLVNVLPDGSGAVCGTSFAPQGSSELQHWNSVDGSRVFFLGSDCVGSPVRLYRRDLAGATTTLISGPALSGPEAPATFLQADRDGEAVVYLTAAQLTAEDLNSDVDAYRWSEGEGNVCLTCVVADADIVGEAVASEDLSHVYFVSEHELAPGGSDGTQNLYVWHTVDGQPTIDYISPFQIGGQSTLTSNPRNLGALTPDGDTLIFASRSTALDPLTGRSNGGHLQYYRYNDTLRTLTCVSCPSTDAATTDVPSVKVFGGTAALGGTPLLSFVRVLSDAGDRFVFMTDEPLLAGDFNEGRDLYEWHDGQVRLITDGVSDPGTANDPTVALYGMSADGRDVIFTAFAKLTPDAVDRSQHLYDARIGGGFAFPTARVCEGQACQEAPSPAASLRAIGSLDFDGPAAATRLRVKIVHAGSRGHRIVVRVRVPGAGRLRVSGERVRRVGRRVSGPGVVGLRVRLSAAAAGVLRREHRVRVSLRVRYVPVSGEGSSARVRVLVRG